MDIKLYIALFQIFNILPLFYTPSQGNASCYFQLRIKGMIVAHAALRNFIPYFWRQDQLFTITGIKAINDCQLSHIRYQEPLQLSIPETDGFWIN